MTASSGGPTDLIFVHGALVRDGEWWWRPTAELLLERTGIPSRSVRLPSCGESAGDAAEAGLAEDAAALRRELDAVAARGGSAIVVGHSYGGTVIAEAGHHPAVARLVYISSYLPDIGQAQGAIMSGESDPVSVADNGDGTIEIAGYDAASFGARFLQDVDGDRQREAFARVSGQAIAAFGTPTSAAGWQGVDSTYLVCTDDRSTSMELQRFHAGRTTRSVDLPTGHHPFLSRPDLVVDQIAELLEAR
ncbi:alpha/beta hydrolase [Naasia lichenicola]|uniref:Alpha/beta hydrolase n=1 Tax=Naasia lichenicola TaxID=2565933 RepID=A0A4S4FF24_9MICO|nr:alpha/beta hydrolase [Naasia lichenicola]THG28721.1 alpha/beta hydrolase [Naasia lichenicola]